MEPKTKIEARVIVEWDPYPPGDDLHGKTPKRYAAGYVEGFGGSDIVVRLPMGVHLFARADGTWLEGPCTNYVNARIQNIADVEAAIRAGYGGDVVAHKASLPVDVPAQA